MITIIAGSRTCTDYEIVREAVANSNIEPSVVVCGGARGVDRLGALWARSNDVDIAYFLADWSKYGKGAGKVRNIEMAKYAEALIAIWDGISPGTGHMIDTARAMGLKIYVELY